MAQNNSDMFVHSNGGSDGIYYQTKLNSDWRVFSTEVTREEGENISLPGFHTDKWYTADVPATVLAALRQSGYYPDIFFGDNILKVDSTRFEVPWWYRKVFSLNGSGDDHNYRLTFEGLNYRANIWLNGNLLAGEDKIEGAFGMWHFDISALIVDGDNVLAVEVIPPVSGDLTMGFVDWNPEAPDRNMGLWRGVILRRTGLVSIDRPNVVTRVNTDELDEAWINISSVLKNYSPANQEVELVASFDDISVSKLISLEPYQEKEVTLTPDEFKKLHLTDPRLWWPNNIGDPHLYDISISVSINNVISDSEEFRFGVREIGSYMTPGGYLGFLVNGRKVLVKGGGWVDDMLLADSDEKVVAQVDYAKHMNLNTLRLEGFWGNSKTLYERCDENGIMLMIGWSCQWEWKRYCGREEGDFMSVNSTDEMELQTRAFMDQVYWLRYHPSVFLWNFGSDKLPPPELERMLHENFSKADTTRPLLSHCGGSLSEISGPSGVKMYGPYDWVPPVYWYVDRKFGGAYGFNTETGPGPQVPPAESIKRMFPEENHWPVDDMWGIHCGTFEFDNLNRFLKAFNTRYGKSDNLEEFAFKNQISNYEAMRPMFEAFAVNKYESTAVIQWMFNSAWPAMYWQLFDYFLMPNGAFYGAKKANEPLTAIYNYGDNTVYIHNEFLHEWKGLRLIARIFDIESKELYSQEALFNIGPNISDPVIKIPEIEAISSTWFLDLRIVDAAGDELTNNFYWLSVKKDVLEFDSTYWLYTPAKEFADLKGLNTMTGVSPEFDYQITEINENIEVVCQVSNQNDVIAFFIELTIIDSKTGRAVLPVFWDDNYISLIPGETRILKGRVDARIVERSDVEVIFKGWNTK